MKKLRLDADRLAVESFQTAGDRQTPAHDLLATRPGVCDPVTTHPQCPEHG